MGNTGVQMTGWFKKPIEKVDDLKGLNMRIPGLAGRVYAQLGVDVKLLPAGEIFPALERGVIDAAEFVGPYQDRRLGLHKAAKYLYTTGWHESSTVTELIVNKAAWNSLPPDLQEIVKRPPLTAGNQSVLVRCHQYRGTRGPDRQPGRQGRTAVAGDHRQAERGDGADAQRQRRPDPLIKKVHDSYIGFKKGWDKWAAISEGVYHSQIRGQI